MFKKLVITGASAALVLGMAIPAFADWSMTINKAHVWNDVTTAAQSGGNKIGGFVVSGNPYIVTSPSTAKTLDVNLVNTNVGQEGFTINKAHVGNLVETDAISGSNTITGGFVSGGTISAGPSTAGTAVVNVVNTNLSFHH